MHFYKPLNHRVYCNKKYGGLYWARTSDLYDVNVAL